MFIYQNYYLILLHNQNRKEMKTKKSTKVLVGVIDDTFTEVDLSEFLKDNPAIMADLKKKYKL